MQIFLQISLVEISLQNSLQNSLHISLQNSLQISLVERVVSTEFTVHLSLALSTDHSADLSTDFKVGHVQWIAIFDSGNAHISGEESSLESTNFALKSLSVDEFERSNSNLERFKRANLFFIEKNN